MSKSIYKIIALFFILPSLYSCWSYTNSDGMPSTFSILDVSEGLSNGIKNRKFKVSETAKNNIEKVDVKLANSTAIMASSKILINYQGWWIYGEEQHIFKDESTLGEWPLKFPNENKKELAELYLSVCEMEYFPMYCNMEGTFNGDTLVVTNFEILFIEGCDD